MIARCSLPIEDLVAYVDGDLRAGRKELVEAHLSACPACRAQLAEFREVDRILQEESPLRDDPAGRAALRARLEVVASRRARPPRTRLFALLAAALLLLLALLWLRPAGGVTAGWSRLFPLAATPGRAVLPERQEPPGTALRDLVPAGASQASFAAVAPPHLPGGLTLVAQATVRPERLELRYRAEGGLLVRLVELPAQGTAAPPGGTRQITVGGTTVAWLPGATGDTVSVALWERDGLAFELDVLAQPSQGLLVAEAEQIVAALGAAQEGAR